jgi:hypothetical protein
MPPVLKLLFLRAGLANYDLVLKALALSYTVNNGKEET